MNESNFTKNVHKRLPDNVFKWKINDNFFGGIPDSFLTRLDNRNRGLYLEYKLLKQIPKRPNTVIKPKLSALQRSCIKQLRQAGEQVIVVLGVERHPDHRHAVGAVLTEQQEIALTANELTTILLDYKGLSCKIYNYL